ncbi:MAG: ATP-dependent DNA helicase [Candidatus Staskawiczbacteria bacterium]|jgi:DNA helicase-2/ATP-dependent DNA helicase PcrA
MNNEIKEKFNTLYKQLNPEQRTAVDEIEGPIMVIAGPGTGKTHLLTMRIANILDKTDTPPEAILALTFTESAVASMRKNLSEIIGTMAYRVTITTFHGFTNNIIKDYPDEFPNIIGSTNISGVDQIKIIREILDNSNFATLKPWGNNYYYVPAIIHAISDLKQQGLVPEEFEKVIEKQANSFETIDDLYHSKGAHKGKMKGKYIALQKNIERNKELVVVYKKYQEKMRENHSYDFSDMIIEVKKVLENNNNLLLILQEQYQYMLVDEHQDTNNAQNKILELLASYYENPNLFIVGDEKQAIFRFQGASLENFLYFKNLYSKVKEISLKHNYRSTQTILNAAHNLKPNSIELLSNSGHAENNINIRPFLNLDAENYFIANEIKGLIDNNQKPEQIAVLYRENRDVFPIARIFRKFDIPFTIESDQDILDDQDIKKLLIILKAVQKFGSDRELVELLYVDVFEIEPLDVYKLSSFNKGGLGIYDLMKSEKLMQEAGIENIEKLQAIYEKLSKWKKQSHNKNAVAVFENIIRDSGLLAKILSDPLAPEKIQKIGVFFDQVKALITSHKDYTLDNFFDYLDVLKEHNISIKSKGLGYTAGRVRLMTAHKSKGLEFDHVYIVNAQEGHWGSRRSHENIKLPNQIYSLLNKIEEDFVDDDDQDERNLFYVALTRAKKQITITYAEKNSEGREKLVSLFVGEIKPELTKVFELDKTEIKLEDSNSIEYAEDIDEKPTIKEKSFLNELFIKNGLSVTALNNYLSCPWKYFFSNLIRIPGAQNKYSLFGSAVHEALSNYFDALADNKNPTKEYLIKRFKESLSAKSIQTKEYNEMLERGEAFLLGYYKFYNQSWKSHVLNEVNIRRIELAKDVSINGKIDKIEILDDKNNVNVVDYKTGKLKSRKELLGENKNSDGEYLRQLTFYKLLLDNYQNGKYKMASGEIDFIQPDEKGNYKKEFFTITPEMASELAETIKFVAKEILDLSFWDKTCENKKCEFCALKKMINLKHDV